MKRKVFLSLLYTILLYIGTATAQKRIVWEPVAIDSIVFLDQSRSNPLVRALDAYPILHPIPLNAFMAAQPKGEVPDSLHQLYEASAGTRPYVALYDVLHVGALNQRMLAGEATAAEADTLERLLLGPLPYLMNDTTDEKVSLLGAFATMAAMQMYCLIKGRDVRLNFYQNCFVHVQTDSLNVTIDQVADMPFLPNVRLRIGGIRSQTPFTLQLRRPCWAVDAEPTIYINGREEVLPVEAGYYTIRRRWNAGDEVFFSFNLQPRFEGERLLLGGVEYVAIERNEAARDGVVYNRLGHPVFTIDGTRYLPAMDIGEAMPIEE